MRCFKKMCKNLILYFFLFFFIAMGWLTLVPMWHTPDEQAHFGQVAYIAETGRNTRGDDSVDLTEEIYISEELLGTKRDQFGNNKFTFHPEYRIEFSDSYLGIYEASISALTQTQSRNKFVHLEATVYPPLYYTVASWIYSALHQEDLFTRVFAVRIWSASLYVANVLVIYLLGRIIFNKDDLYASIFPILVGLMPMFVFADIGVTSDALGNFLFSLFLYFSARILKSGCKPHDVLIYTAVTVLNIYTKPQFIITVPLAFLLCLFVWFKNPLRKKISLNRIWIFIPILILYLWKIFVLKKGIFSLLWLFVVTLNVESLISFTISYTIPHTIREVMPWYWGVYNWLGVTYPRFVHRILNRVVGIACIGFIIWFIRMIKDKKWKESSIQIVLYLIITQLLFFFSVSFYDWLAWYLWKYPLGVQGRYFFPLISGQMIVILLGLRTILPKMWKMREWGIKLLGIGMMVLNVYGYYTVAKAYYNVSTFDRFITQASQYKPIFAKGPMFLMWFFFYLAACTFLSIYILSIKEPSRENR